MNDLQIALGIDYKILIFQIINFTLIFLIIYHFFSKPISKILEERKQKIEAGLKKSEEAEKLIQEVRLLREKIIQEANQQRTEILKKTEEERETLLTKIKAEVDLKREELYQRLKEEEKLIKEKLLIEIGNQSKEIFLNLARKIFNKPNLDREFIEIINDQRRNHN
ncbi:MAG: ATP synthase subunit b [Candidatus Parcubacteria bacterium]|nr:MAG: ATP synthase subunit b [Candidatus Parcubacteria bacterium]